MQDKRHIVVDIATSLQNSMVNIVFKRADGRDFLVDVATGITLMEAAVKNNVPGIDAECGGACACATCHVYVDEAWRAAVGEPELMERSMLDFAAHPGPGSRLSCQIKVTTAMEGLVVRLPTSQS